MKRIILSAIALSMLALPTIEAQAGPRHGSQTIERYDSQWNNKKPDHMRKKPDQMRKKHVKKRWERGNHVPSWQRRNVVRDYHRHGLRRPAYGQQWVKVDNDYLLIGIASGLIAGLIAGH